MMWSFYSTDSDIRQIGEGGNNRIYKLEREYCGYSTAIIRVNKRNGERNVSETIQKYNLLRKLGINTTAFLHECTLDGVHALVTEDLHQVLYTYLDANAHILREVDVQLRYLDANRGTNHFEIEPEEERWFANNKFKGIIDLAGFIQCHVARLASLLVNHLYIASDCYFFRVSRQPFTELNYIIADWDDIGVYDNENDLTAINIEQFKVALMQFVDKFVERDSCDYMGEIERVFFEYEQEK